MNHLVRLLQSESQSVRKTLIMVLAALGLAGLSVPNVAFADSVHYDGAPVSESLAFTDVETREIIDYVQVPSTCYRTEYVPERVCRTVNRSVCQTQNVCRDVTDSVCKTDPAGRRTCTPVKRRECSDQRVCRIVPDTVCQTFNRAISVPYACMRTVTRKRTVMDYTLDVEVSVRIAEAPTSARADETLSITTRSGALSVQSQSRFNELLLIGTETRHVEVVREKSGDSLGHKRIFIDYVVTPVSVSEVAESLNGGIQNLRLVEGGVVHADLGTSYVSDLIGFDLRIDRHKSIVGDARVFNAPLSRTSVQLSPRTATGSGTHVAIDLKSLGLREALKSGSRYNVELGLSVRAQNLGQSLINPSALGGLNRVSAKVKKQLLSL